MYKILIDTTQRYKKSVRLLSDGKVTAEKFGDIDVVTSIKEILTEKDLGFENIERFDVNSGPGSFTGIKIGVTIANVLNWALGKVGLSDLVEPNYGREPNITLTKGKNI